MPEADEKMKKEFDEWLRDRPAVIKELAEKLPPWNRYQLKTTGQHCHLYSYSEDGTVTITVDGHDSEILDAMNSAMPINVFGISSDDLEVLA